MPRPRKTGAKRAAKRIAYRRVSTEDQARSGLGLDAQRDKLQAEAERREWADVEWLTDDGYSAKTLNRPALQEGLRMLAEGEASVLVVAKLDRLSRSVVDFANLITRAEREDWAIVSLDPEIDMTNATGRMFAKLVVLISEWEREIIGERTSAALQAKKGQGARLGRPRGLPISVVYRIGELRGQGETLQSIADTLTAERIPTRDGGRWWPSTIAAVIESIRLDQEAEAHR
jgi:DNA invertase Pin-like site-specific DNA recombinase